ncbi:MAG TPA: hypothetical protein VK272_13800 [Solirubrobacteraceae bacterium]|nr:hypothetical protein [Solirubrobacteraceae bacterium]
MLDEAIREHLELKRRHGADPTAVAREEREALTPIFSDERDAADDGHGELVHEAIPEATPAGSPLAGVVLDGDAQLAENAPLGSLSTAAQDTAELDMGTVLGEDSDALGATPPADSVAHEAVQAAYAGEMSGEASVEWDFPSEHDREPPHEDAPGQERLSFD